MLTCDEETFAPFDGHHIKITRPEQLGGEDWAAALRHAGVAVQYGKVAADAFKHGLIRVGVPEDMATNITAIHTCFYDGSAQVAEHATTPGLQGLPGIPARRCRFEAFVTEVVPVFQPSGDALRMRREHRGETQSYRFSESYQSRQSLTLMKPPVVKR